MGHLRHDRRYLFLDCEGFGSTDSDTIRDAKLMALTLLISSVFLLNSKGPLSENQFANLGLVCDLGKFIQDQGVIMNKPSLLWLLRDFSLQLEDTYGNPFTADEYLERALSSTPDNAYEREKMNQAKEVLAAVVGGGRA